MTNKHISELFPAAGSHSQRPVEPDTSPVFFACSEHNLLYRWNGTSWQTWLTAGGDSGVSDHGDLTGLTDDDHTQYHTDARGDVRYYPRADVDTALAGKSDTSHNHDSSYYTESETDTLLAAKAATVHTHAIGDVTNLQTTLDGKSSTSHNHDATYSALGHAHAAADVTSGRFDIARLPTSAPIVVDKAKNGGTWPARPTADTSVTVIWIGDTDPGAAALDGDIWEEV